MPHSFGLVEDKLREADFFLTQLRQASRISFEADCYFSAFVSAARSVTFAMQASMNGVPGFAEWYEAARDSLKTDALATYFVELRNDIVHIGASPLNRISPEHLMEQLTRSLRGEGYDHMLVVSDRRRRTPTRLVDAVWACETYFASLVALVYGCYRELKTVVDPRWYLTEANFASMGRSFEDALCELGFPPNWTAGVAIGPEAWRALRMQEPPCLVNDIFERILGQTIADPDEQMP